ncbi:AbrB family transcriptional regulator [Lentilactobacillus fungorum]|jgi:putative addiction module antidote|uniref:AbrB family transcriptional regulator n=1 Tax=Lentilactobacillus fungorum TaxID=2201250 RepID=A0ABQ3W5Z8_9LACO|nr:AbrB family transcriptional regulator [Lentilactobacillus fungorum]GHP14784.1 AbrB family transcriptional regulator [Lentilactobacillus fungorum]
MAKIKVRKIGNSLGVILPKDSGISEGDELEYTKEDETIKLSLVEAQKAHDRALIEKSFEDVEKGNLHTEEEMKQIFGKYGWGK